MPTTLTDAFIKNLSTPGRYTDAATAGLNLQVKPNLGKYWALRYVCGGKRQDISLGAYPTVTLKEARLVPLTCAVRSTKASSPKLRGEHRVRSRNKPPKWCFLQTTRRSALQPRDRSGAIPSTLPNGHPLSSALPIR